VRCPFAEDRERGRRPHDGFQVSNTDSMAFSMGKRGSTECGQKWGIMGNGSIKVEEW